MNYTALLFDLDGTLLDTTELIIKSFQHTCRTMLKKNVRPEELYPYFGKPLRTALESLGPDCVDRLVETYRSYNLRHHDNMVGIFPGVAKTLECLAQQGVKMAIVTSKTEQTTLRGLRLFGLDAYFEVIIGLYATPKHKPDPTPVLLALEQLQAAPEAALMVGDSPFDLQSARNAGVKTAAVRWSVLPWTDIMAENPDYVLEKIEDLLDIVKEAGG